jgi:TrmH family RNA methyltransferase
MLSKNKIKLITSLETKKHRVDNGLFVAEGEKIVHEMLHSQFSIVYLAATEEWFRQNQGEALNRCPDKDIVSQEELTKVSFLKTPQNVLCVAKLPNYGFGLDTFRNNLSLILDTVQDPGNVGTILRIADWFGIEHIVCSPDTADIFNPKVVQSTMGAICRVKVYYEDLNEILPAIKSLELPLYGASLEGENIYNAPLTKHGFIMMGNESRGIKPALIPLLDKQLFIPFYPENNKRSESLNVAVATAIICSEFRRKLI